MDIHNLQFTNMDKLGRMIGEAIKTFKLVGIRPVKLFAAPLSHCFDLLYAYVGLFFYKYKCVKRLAR